MPNKRPLITSSGALRGIATAVTFLSVGGMTAFAATHAQNVAAPLQPAAPSTTTVAAAPTATPRTTTATSRRTTITSSVTTTTTSARTKTHTS